MSKPCRICTHPEREAIDQAIISDVPYRSITEQYGVSNGSIARHKEAGHISQALIQANEVREITRSADLLDMTMSLLNEAQDIVEESRQEGDRRTALDGIGKITNILKLLMAVNLALSDRQAKTSVTTDPEFQRVMSVIMEELDPYPEVRERISTRLSEVRS
jgi:hypothetical protein